MTEIDFCHKFCDENRSPSQIVTKFNPSQNSDGILFSSQIFWRILDFVTNFMICDGNLILSQILWRKVYSVTTCDGIRFPSKNLWRKLDSVKKFVTEIIFRHKLNLWQKMDCVTKFVREIDFCHKVLTEIQFSHKILLIIKLHS